jgi:zinc finger CCHC domain-containing protein 8
MRVLGYPPGWLKIADMRSSVVNLMDGGKPVDDKPTLNEGVTYNVESFIAYPGFNRPVPEGVEDNYAQLRMPAPQQHQQLDFATSTMKTPKPVPFKRLRITSSASTMNSESPLTASENVGTSESAIGESLDSSIEVLEASQDTSVLDIKEEIQDGNISIISVTKTPEIQATKRLISVGVPVPDSYNMIKPPLEKWSENNSLAELIYFENLPNSTGVFDKMRGVLGKVREKLFSSSEAPEASTSDKEVRNATADAETKATNDAGTKASYEESDVDTRPLERTEVEVEGAVIIEDNLDSSVEITEPENKTRDSTVEVIL